MTTYTITPINLGTLHGVERGNLTLKRHLGEKTTVPTVMWIIQGGGKVVVADTGTGDPIVVQERFKRTVDRQQGPVEALAAMGLKPTDVSAVVVTHLHWDHAGDLSMFPNAKLFVQRSELAWAVSPPAIQNEIYELGPHTQAIPRWLESIRQMQVLDGDHELAPGLRLIHLPGHTPGSMGVAVETSRGVYMVASDTIPTYENWDDEIPAGWYYDIKAWYETYARIRGITDNVLPGHDLRVFEHDRYPNGA